MTERGHDALPGRTEGTAGHGRREPVKAVRLHLMPLHATRQDGGKSPALIVKRLGVAYRPTHGKTARRLHEDGETARTTAPWRPIDRLRSLAGSRADGGG